MADKGKCPNCYSDGLVGEECEERGCAVRGYRFIPMENFERLSRKNLLGEDPYFGRKINKYLIIDLIGAGGFGTVYLALQMPVEMRCALKLIKYEGSEDRLKLMLTKFDAEAKALAQLNHPNIVRLIDYGVVNEKPYMVMEYVNDSVTLKDKIEEYALKGESFDIKLTIGIIDQILRGLGASHKLKIIHRDIKPENIMLQRVFGESNFVRILDFGLAKFTEDKRQTSITMGTPSYMAPEQILGSKAGPWTDLYALGVVVFELLTGRTPFSGRTVQEMLSQKLSPSYDPLSIVDDLKMPERIKTFFHLALARKADERYRNVEAFRKGLTEVAGIIKTMNQERLSQSGFGNLLSSAEFESAAARAAARGEDTPDEEEGESFQDDFTAIELDFKVNEGGAPQDPQHKRTVLAATPDKAAPGRPLCPDCGAPNKPRAVTCGQCARPLGGGAERPATLSQVVSDRNEGGGSKKILIVSIVSLVLVLALAAGVVLYLTSGRSGKAVLSSKPPGAVVTVDGEAKGEAPVTVELDVGEHKVTFTKQGFATVEKTVTIEKGKESKLLADMACARQCNDKTCGPDGCGGVCGNCTKCGETCTGGACAFTACKEKKCGDDGCGGVCGTCDEGHDCTDGACVAAGQATADVKQQATPDKDVNEPAAEVKQASSGQDGDEVKEPVKAEEVKEAPKGEEVKEPAKVVEVKETPKVEEIKETPKVEEVKEPVEVKETPKVEEVKEAPKASTDHPDIAEAKSKAADMSKAEKKEEARKYSKAGNSLYSSKSFEKALLQYRISQVYKPDVKLFKKMAFASQKAGDDDKAEEYFLKYWNSLSPARQKQLQKLYKMFIKE